MNRLLPQSPRRTHKAVRRDSAEIQKDMRLNYDNFNLGFPGSSAKDFDNYKIPATYYHEFFRFNTDRKLPIDADNTVIRKVIPEPIRFDSRTKKIN